RALHGRRAGRRAEQGCAWRWQRRRRRGGCGRGSGGGLGSSGGREREPRANGGDKRRGHHGGHPRGAVAARDVPGGRHNVCPAADHEEDVLHAHRADDPRDNPRARVAVGVRGGELHARHDPEGLLRRAQRGARAPRRAGDGARGSGRAGGEPVPRAAEEQAVPDDARVPDRARAARGVGQLGGRRACRRQPGPGLRHCREGGDRARLAADRHDAERGIHRAPADARAHGPAVLRHGAPQPAGVPAGVPRGSQGAAERAAGRAPARLRRLYADPALFQPDRRQQQRRRRRRRRRQRRQRGVGRGQVQRDAVPGAVC
ncbi:hypothetical protein IWQ56_007386, partial [Coemansia nantahalensis]